MHTTPVIATYRGNDMEAELFAEVLNQRLRHEHPELVPGLHRSASVWFADQGLMLDAILRKRRVKSEGAELDGTPVGPLSRSRNGLYVNGLRVTQARLRNGDEVQVGARVMRFLEVAATPR